MNQPTPTTPNPIILESGALALAGLAGMYADEIKKVAYHGHQLNIVKARQMVGEIGRLQRAALAWINLQSGTCVESEVEP